MKIPPQLIMLAVVGVTGSVLFAAGSNKQSELRPVAMAPKAEVDPDKKVTDTTGDLTTKPGDGAKTDPAKTDTAKADTKADATKPETTKDAATAKAEAPADADKAGDKPAAEKGAATAKSAADRGPSPQRFVPSEEVRADFDVSFPVDI